MTSDEQEKPNNEEKEHESNAEAKKKEAENLPVVTSTEAQIIGNVKIYWICGTFFIAEYV